MKLLLDVFRQPPTSCSSACDARDAETRPPPISRVGVVPTLALTARMVAVSLKVGPFVLDGYRFASPRSPKAQPLSGLKLFLVNCRLLVPNPSRFPTTLLGLTTPSGILHVTRALGCRERLRRRHPVMHACRACQAYA